MVIGDPVEHSLSPLMHNAGYKVLRIDDKYVYVACNVKTGKLEDFINGVRAMGIRGISCTIPHKIKVMKYLDEIDETANKIGAVNTIVNENGMLKGYNTDWIGIVIPFRKITSLKNKKVALLGAGGAARAAAYGVVKGGAKLTIYNRTIEKAQVLAKGFGASACSFEETKDIKTMDIIINATSTGLNPNIFDSPLDKELFTEKQIVFDIIYSPYETKFLKEAKQKGAKIIHGLEMFLQQGIAQFKLFTGLDVPEVQMRNILLKQILSD